LRAPRDVRFSSPVLILKTHRDLGDVVAPSILPPQHLHPLLFSKMRHQPFYVYFSSPVSKTKNNGSKKSCCGSEHSHAYPRTWLSNISKTTLHCSNVCVSSPASILKTTSEPVHVVALSALCHIFQNRRCRILPKISGEVEDVCFSSPAPLLKPNTQSHMLPLRALFFIHPQNSSRRILENPTFNVPWLRLLSPLPLQL
jgi:hypothetical protein